MELRDEHATFNLRVERGGGEFGGMYGGQTFGGSDRYYKKYIQGEYLGRMVDIWRSEFDELVKEHEALYGTGGKDDFTPGLLRPTLPEIYVDPLESFKPPKPEPI